jgi:hypothetical protein
VILDDLVDSAVAAVQIRFPNYYSEASLARLGVDRGICRGYDQSAESYAAQLRRWRQDRAIDGSHVPLAQQLHAYFSGHDVPIEIVNNNGRTTAIDAAGYVTITDAYPTWDWDGHPEWWSRFWIVIHAHNIWSTDGVWDDPGVWDDGGVWDCDATPEQVDSIHAIVRAWRPPHAECTNIIVVLKASEWIHVPDGTWGDCYGRDPNLSYWAGA